MFFSVSISTGCQLSWLPAFIWQYPLLLFCSLFFSSRSLSFSVPHPYVVLPFFFNLSHNLSSSFFFFTFPFFHFSSLWLPQYDFSLLSLSIQLVISLDLFYACIFLWNVLLRLCSLAQWLWLWITYYWGEIKDTAPLCFLTRVHKGKATAL